MLVLGRKVGESLDIGDGDLIIKVTKIRGNKVSFGIIADRRIKVIRSELKDKPHTDAVNGVTTAKEGV